MLSAPRRSWRSVSLPAMPPRTLWTRPRPPENHLFGSTLFPQAAHLLLQALPAAMDPYGFAIPPPSAWAEQAVASSAGVERAEPARTAAAVEGAEGAGGRGVPLRLVAQQPDVAWEVDGQLQLLIGAAKRTGDPSDVW